MNIEQAFSIPIIDVLDKLGHVPVKKRATEYLYLSPLRSERTASFTVNIKINAWFDFGTGKGGGIIKFAKAWLESEHKPATTSDALKWLSSLSGIAPTAKTYIASVEEENKIVLRSSIALKSASLIDYLEHRGIPIDLANNYLKELKFSNKESGKMFYAIGLKNDKGGYEYRTTGSFKASHGKKSITSLRGSAQEPEGIHLFEGFMDFLSMLALEEKTKLSDDAIVLNSAYMLREALPLLSKPNYKYIYTWFDNDPTGNEATETVNQFCKTHPPLNHTAMNNNYASFKDVNEWLMHLLG